MFFTLYLLILEASLEQDYNIIRSNNQTNAILLASSILIQSYYQLLGQVATYALSSIPKPRVERILYPNVLRSEFQGRDFFGELRRCEHLFWSLTGESIHSLSYKLYAMLVLQVMSKQEEETVG